MDEIKNGQARVTGSGVRFLVLDQRRGPDGAVGCEDIDCQPFSIARSHMPTTSLLCPPEADLQPGDLFSTGDHNPRTALLIELRGHGIWIAKTQHGEHAFNPQLQCLHNGWVYVGREDE